MECRSVDCFVFVKLWRYCGVISNLLQASGECDALVPKRDDASAEDGKEDSTIASLNHNIDEYTSEQLDGVLRNVIESIKKALKSNEQEVMIDCGLVPKMEGAPERKGETTNITRTRSNWSKLKANWQLTATLFLLAAFCVRLFLSNVMR